MLRAWKVEHWRGSDKTRESLVYSRRGLQLKGFANDEWDAQSPASFFFDPSARDLVLSKTKRGFVMSAPLDVAVTTEEMSIPAVVDSTGRHRIELTSEPKELRFQFANGEEIRVQQSEFDWLSYAKTFRVLPMLVMACGVHLFAAFVGLFLWDTPEPKIPDISQVKVSFDLSTMRSAPATSSGGAGMKRADLSPEQRAAQQQRALLRKMTLGGSRPSYDLKKIEESRDWAADENLELASASQGGGIGFDGPEIDEKPLDLSADIIRESLEVVRPSLKECYDDALLVDATLAGKPQVVLQVAANGRVNATNVLHLKGNPRSVSQLTRCMELALQRVRFPSANQDFAVTKTFILTR
jgi:hypothetical protein